MFLFLMCLEIVCRKICSITFWGLEMKLSKPIEIFRSSLPFLEAGVNLLSSLLLQSPHYPLSTPNPILLHQTQVFLALDFMTDLRDLAFLQVHLTKNDWGKEDHRLFSVVSCLIQQQALIFLSLPLLLIQLKKLSSCQSRYSPGSTPDRLWLF